MALSNRRSRRTTDIWPGFVDALATLLIILIFILLVFVLGQFFLSQALSGKDQALERLSQRVDELADLLSLERQANADLRLNLSQLSTEVQNANATADELRARLAQLSAENDELENNLAGAQAEKLDLEEDLRNRLAQIATLETDIKALRALKTSLEEEIRHLDATLSDQETRLENEKEISAEARAQAALLNSQLEALQKEIARLNEALDAADAESAAQKAQIADLGKRLNRALASKVQELNRYRSEFFGRLREVLGDRQDIRIEGDRFVFQSEILFASASATLGEEGKKSIASLGETLLEIARNIPEDINWILRVDGHTDKRPIKTADFKSNWELSSARAISVVRHLIELGVPPERLVAAGFGEYQPLAEGDSPAVLSLNRRIEFKLDQR